MSSGQARRTPARKPRIRALVVDDHPITRAGLVSALTASNEVEVAGEAASGEDALTEAQRLTPDVVFMDVRMPGIGGIEATRRIVEAVPDTKVILFTVDDSPAIVADAMRAGISGYLLKESGPEEVIHAARLALEGQVYIHPTVAHAMLDEVRFNERRPDTPLSRRETQILQKVADGATTKEVAHQLAISPHTVKTHLERIYDKLGANDRAQAVAIAIRIGIVT